MDISRTCDAGEVAVPGCWKSREGKLAAPSGAPRSVNAHVALVVRGSCITVVEDMTVDDDAEQASEVTLAAAG